MRLYSYWRSTTSYRVRIALNLKGVAFETTPVDLMRGEQSEAAYARLNPSQGVPALVLDDGTVLTQSMAILDWLEETHPTPPLLPTDATARAQTRGAALVIATDIHPVNNLRVVARLGELGHDAAVRMAWMNDWMTRGFHALSRMIMADTVFCFGDAPSFADVCLVPQLYNARRWGCDLAPFARLTGIEARCLALPGFAAAQPELQSDAT